MGDRFYQAQLEATGDCPGAPWTEKREAMRNKKPRRTKADMVEELPKGAEKLLVKDIELLLEAWPVRVQVEMPEPVRRKAPYVEALQESVQADIDWTKLTIKELQGFLSQPIALD